jgi:hypothetical protein
LKNATIRAVLFDVGGPLDTEVTYERLIDQHISEALAAEGIVVSDDEYAMAARYAVESFAWNAQQRSSGASGHQASRWRAYGSCATGGNHESGRIPIARGIGGR